ncbi:MAG: hypothetical protein K2N38_13595 [Oscillospiraceae bacterium]|nr:hypothetical protein [Oscillospiraceae bacterium]
MSIGTVIQSYAVIAAANGYVMGKSPTAPQPYAVWKVDDDGKGVCIGHYFFDREEAEWDFCARAFEWFEDNVNIHMIEDGEETSETHSVFDTPTSKEQPLDRGLIDGLREIGMHMTMAAKLVDEMCAIVDGLKAERRGADGNDNND